MLYANVCNGNLYDVPLGDPGNPIIAANRREPLGHSLIECCRGHLDSVCNTFYIANRDAA